MAGRRLYWAFATIMNAFLAAFLFFVGALGATLFGFLLRNKLPEHHVSEHSRSIIVLSTKLIATMTALLLGLLVSSANDSLQSFNSGLEQMGARLATTDRLLKDYGPETREVRHSLREHAALSVAVIWPEERERLVSLNLFATGQLPRSGWDGAVRDASHAVRALAISSFLPEIEGKLLDLKPQDEAKRWRQAEALRQLGLLAEQHWLLVEKAQNTVPVTLLVLLLAWLLILFTTFGLFAPRNATVTTVLVLCAVSASAAVFVILEMNSVTSGLLKVSGEPLIRALSVMGG